MSRKDDEVALKSADREGYLMTRRVSEKALREYRYRCRAMSRPYIEVRERRVYASIFLDTDTCSPFSFDLLATEDIDNIRQHFAETCPLKRDAWISVGGSGGELYGVHAVNARYLAHLVYQIALNAARANWARRGSEGPRPD